MLILSRRESECIHLGDDIVLTIVRVSGEKVRIGVEAPPHVKILRNELELSKPDQASPESDITGVSKPTELASPRQAHPEPVTPIQIPTPSAVRKVPIQVKRAA
ncbi:MAG: carbon storage regulator [Planctomycetota bacterium]|nr:carbon storage regulator [Planctomycetota bacterium]